jgi:4'-phosphopantetheinyl transferase
VTSDVVYVWLISADLPATVLAAVRPLLDETEQQRAEALAADRDRRWFIAAHGAARIILGHHLGAPPGQIRWQHGPYGKPELAGAWTGVQVNLSHSGALAVLAITGRRRVGVDVERLWAGLDATRLSARFYPPAEAQFVAAGRGHSARVSRFVRLWTRKEACVKVTGGRLMQGMSLPVRGGSRVVVHDPGGPLPGPYLVRDVPVRPGFRASVALEGAAAYRVERRLWPTGSSSRAEGRHERMRPLR